MEYGNTSYGECSTTKLIGSCFVAEDYESLVPSGDGLLKSTVFPGLWLDPAALIRGDMARGLAVLQQGLNSREHADFRAKLRTDEK